MAHGQPVGRCIIGVLSALVERARTGRGQTVTTSLYESQLALHINWATGFFATGRTPQRLGSGHPSLVPYQAYPAADGHFVIAIGNDGLWQRLCALLGRHELADDLRFRTNQDRVVHRDELKTELETTLRGGTVGHWCTTLKAGGIPVTPIRTLDEVYASPHTDALGIVQEVDHPAVGQLEQVGFPVNYSGNRPRVRTAPPTLGQHNHEILSELGYSDQQIQDVGVGDVVEPARVGLGHGLVRRLAAHAAQDVEGDDVGRSFPYGPEVGVAQQARVDPVLDVSVAAADLHGLAGDAACLLAHLDRKSVV